MLFRSPTNLSYEEWDSTALFQATVYAKTFVLRGKTLFNLNLKHFKSKFHTFVVSRVGDKAETFALAINQLRRLINEVIHLHHAQMDKKTLSQFMDYAEEAFKALNVSTDPIKVIRSYTKDDFPTEAVRNLNENIKKELQADKKFLEEEI